MTQFLQMSTVQLWCRTAKLRCRKPLFLSL